MVNRRSVIRAGVLLPLLAACTPDVFGAQSDAVRIAVPWGGAELAAFRAVTDALNFEHRIDMIPLGDDVTTVLSAGRSAPDIVILPYIGQVSGFAERGWLQPLEDAWWSEKGCATPRYVDRWQDYLRVPAAGNRLYGLPFKAAWKSLIWYDRQTLAECGLPPPATWSPVDWSALAKHMDGKGKRLLALGAADGWMLTDFFENMLLAYSRQAYAGLVKSPESRGSSDDTRHAVETVVTILAATWGQRNAISGGIGKALTSQFPDAVRDVFDRRSAVVVVAPDFAEPIVRSIIPDDATIVDRVGVEPFPGIGEHSIVGGDVMVLTRSAQDSGRALIERLADSRTPLPWMRGNRGFGAANQCTPHDYTTLIGPLAERFTAWTAIDLGDRLGTARDRDALWRTLTDFLVALDHDENHEDAVADAVGRILTLEAGRA